MNNSLHNFACAFNTPVTEDKSKKNFFRSVQYKESISMQNRKKIEFQCHITLKLG